MSPACPREPPALPAVCQHPGLCSSDCDQHYGEVWVGGRTKWGQGVAAKTVDWVVKVKLCQSGSWTWSLRNRTESRATATPWVRLASPKAGVFLGCQEGTVAFSEARDMSQLFTFREVLPLPQPLLRQWDGQREPVRLASTGGNGVMCPRKSPST